MTDTTNPTVAPTSENQSGSPLSPDKSRRRPMGYIVVGVVALVLGAAGTFVALKKGVGLSNVGPANHITASPASPTAQPIVGSNDEDGGIYISPARQQLIGVRTAAVGTRDLAQTIRAVGTLAYDETRVTQVHTKIAGWIDELFVDYVGKAVQKGQPLFTIYSPDLVATQQEYLLARKAQQRLSASQFEETRQSADSLLAAARTRLALWDISAAQIAELDRTGEPRKTLTLYAPFSGVVLERNAFSGQYITPEMGAFKLADVSTVWAVAEIFESELANVRVGQTATIELTNAPGSRPITGRISFIAPDIDPATRRVRVRAEIPNPGLSLKPDTFVTLTIQSRGMRTLAVPSEAVIDTGTKQYVILARGQGYFEPRPVTVGAPVQDFYPVVSGLAEADQVVTSAQFLVDSETNLQAAMRAMGDMPSMSPSSAPTRPSGTGEAGGGGANEVYSQTPRVQLDVVFNTQPDPPRFGENVIEAVVKNTDGEPVSDATVTVTFFMPAMPSMGMPAMRAAATLTASGSGVYCGTVQLPSPGRWDVAVLVSRDGRRVVTKRLALVAR